MNTLLDAIKDNQSITELSLPSNRSINPVDSAIVERFVDEHPGIVNLHLMGYQFVADDAIAMIRRLHSLIQFRFSMLRTEHTQLQAQLQGDDEWIVQVWYEQMATTVLVTLSRCEKDQ